MTPALFITLNKSENDMYRITSKALSPYPIETKQGWVTVPAMGSVIVDMTDPQLSYVENSGCYEVEAVSYERSETVKESLTVEPPPPPRPPPTRIMIEGVPHSDERDALVRDLEEMGVSFDRRLGIKKLRKLLNANS